MIHLLGSGFFLGGLLVGLLVMFYIFGFLKGLFVLIALLLIPLILVQKGKGSMGLGALGGGAQMIFGGSGGQTLFQKMTWILGALFVFGSLFISLYVTSDYKKSRFVPQNAPVELPAQK